MMAASVHQRPDAHRTTVSRCAGENRLSTTLVLTVADALDTDPVDLSPALFEVIDPDALDALFDSTDNNDDTSLQFSAWGCTITVFDGDRVRVTVENDLENR